MKKLLLILSLITIGLSGCYVKHHDHDRGYHKGHDHHEDRGYDKNRHDHDDDRDGYKKRK